MQSLARPSVRLLPFLLPTAASVVPRLLPAVSFLPTQPPSLFGSAVTQKTHSNGYNSSSSSSSGGAGFRWQKWLGAAFASACLAAPVVFAAEDPKSATPPADTYALVELENSWEFVSDLVSPIVSPSDLSVIFKLSFFSALSAIPGWFVYKFLIGLFPTSLFSFFDHILTSCLLVGLPALFFGFLGTAFYIDWASTRQNAQWVDENLNELVWAHTWVSEELKKKLIPHTVARIPISHVAQVLAAHVGVSEKDFLASSAQQKGKPKDWIVIFFSGSMVNPHTEEPFEKAFVIVEELAPAHKASIKAPELATKQPCVLRAFSLHWTDGTGLVRAKSRLALPPALLPNKVAAPSARPQPTGLLAPTTATSAKLL
eukprot:gnl/Hemi2/17062_TR5680_c0_g1_i1.p1 gnl/Hemi2/17062_TR5680_c0_g1~~gnl/Hemi2/17062_TR5680_c0_g1_i1.p1  ORF type:complete len:371 (-),score=83.05 gnl/Hemi2/17062_TR5680_c0_g1_i1:79-1191(-)